MEKQKKNRIRSAKGVKRTPQKEKKVQKPPLEESKGSLWAEFLKKHDKSGNSPTNNQEVEYEEKE